ncbi:hypothetical protein Vadar_031414 [Vaccinium darrowii]|uniref:Uncharacterized protein n=1 Tax=Vaccinium darrowii TaxID=229202 RepID=A0ACB7Z7X6_9ERIC|nr:hypothetical protein Vadar_031414 [Vaccinium darrowii]
MQPPTTASTYTTIPISGSDVISRSIQNLSTSLSLHRPWLDFLSPATLDAPSSLSAALTRLRQNSKYFATNYAILISSCAAASLIGSPLSLIAYAAVFFLWLVLYFYREDPMAAWGRHVDDRVVIVGLVLVSVVAIWIVGMVNVLLVGVAVGVLICAVHGVVRNSQGLFLDEDDAVSSGLIVPPAPLASSSNMKDFAN